MKKVEWKKPRKKIVPLIELYPNCELAKKYWEAYLNDLPKLEQMFNGSAGKRLKDYRTKEEYAYSLRHSWYKEDLFLQRLQLALTDTGIQAKHFGSDRTRELLDSSKVTNLPDFILLKGPHKIHLEFQTETDTYPTIRIKEGKANNCKDYLAALILHYRPSTDRYYMFNELSFKNHSKEQIPGMGVCYIFSTSSLWSHNLDSVVKQIQTIFSRLEAAANDKKA